MSKVLIKQVPDKEPNHDGVWVERDADNNRLQGKFQDVFSYLTSLCDPGHHAVHMRRLPDNG